jgi:hypothetical protein
MKRSLILATIILLASSSNLFAQQPTQAKNQSTDQPYKVHATKITLGNAAYAQKVLWAWKYYDNNTLDKAADMFADDIVATLPDGTLIKGKDNFMKGLADYRNSFASVVSEVSACTTLKTPDDPEREVVSIWGMETDTSKDGIVTKVHLNEVWFFNKQGKVVEFHQLAAKDTPDK